MIRRILGLFVALLVWSAPAAAFRYHIRTYGEVDGLSNQAIFGIDQTPDGRAWPAPCRLFSEGRVLRVSSKRQRVSERMYYQYCFL